MVYVQMFFLKIFCPFSNKSLKIPFMENILFSIPLNFIYLLKLSQLLYCIHCIFQVLSYLIPFFILSKVNHLLSNFSSSLKLPITVVLVNTNPQIEPISCNFLFEHSSILFGYSYSENQTCSEKSMAMAFSRRMSKLKKVM